jgi:hypothetical protein
MSKQVVPVVSLEVKMHDMFNIIVLAIIVGIDINYLWKATDVSKIGTDQIGEDYYDLSKILLVSFTIYLLVDFCWILIVPKCVMSNPYGLLVHHIACLLLILFPWNHNEFAWHAAANISVEINTLFLTLRRNAVQNSKLYHFYTVMFYISWVFLRLILYPILVVFFYFEYLRYSKSVDSYYNPLIGAPLLQGAITSLSIVWTVDMILKQFKCQKNM